MGLMDKIKATFSPTQKIINANNESKDAIIARINQWDKYYGNIDSETAKKIDAVKTALSRQRENDKKAAANSDAVIMEIIDKIDSDFLKGNYGVVKVRLDIIISEIEKRANGGRSDDNKVYNTPEILLSIFIAELRCNFEQIKAEYSSAKMKLDRIAAINGEDSNEYQIEYRDFELVEDKYNATSDILLKKMDDRNTKELLKIIENQTQVYAEGNAELNPDEILEKYAALKKEKEIATRITDITGSIRDEMKSKRPSKTAQSTATAPRRNVVAGKQNNIDLGNIKENITRLEQTEAAYNEKIDGINSEYIAVNAELAELIQTRKNMYKGTRAAINSKINSLYSKKCILQKKINIFSAYRNTVSRYLELYSVADAIQDGKNVNELLKDNGIAIDDVESQAMKIQSELKALEAEIAKLDSVSAVIDSAVPQSNTVGVDGVLDDDSDLDDKFDYMLEDPKF